MKITAFEVDHGEAIRPALGYRIEYRGPFRGDFRRHAIQRQPHQVRQRRGRGDPRSGRCTGRASARGRSVEANPRQSHDPTAGRDALRADKPRLAVYTHVILLGPAATAITLQELVGMTRQTYSGPLEVGEDLMTIAIGDRIDVQRAAK